MPNWHDILNEIGKLGSPHDVVRRNYLKKLSDYTGRNTIVYYSGWLQKSVPGTEVNDSDKTGLMTVVNWKFRRKVTPLFSFQRDPLFRLKLTPWS